MWWLPVLGWAFFFIVVIFCAWLSLATDRYYARVDDAEVLGEAPPKEPWYLKLTYRKNRR